MASGFGSQSGEGAARRPEGEEQFGREERQDQLRGSGSADERYRALLEAMLQQSGLGQEGVPEKLDSFEDLLVVARRRRGEPFACDPIGIELVQTVLHKPFRAMIASDEQWRTMTARITQTLCDDPASYDRLSTLWRRLGERCGNGDTR
jgi:hypothetical protein